MNEGMRKRDHLTGRRGDDDALLGHHGHAGAELEQGVEVVRDHHHGEPQGRALIMDPPLLLLDEPTAGLDPSSSDDFCALVRELRAALGLTVIMVTHDLDTLFALSTRVAVLADKKVIVTGPPHEVAHFKHPFIEHFFMGERGQRAMAPLQPPAPAATPNAAAPSKET